MHTPPLILLIDDDPQIHDLYVTLFKKSGFDMLEAWNGEEGIKVAMKEMPDLILLDVMMPIMDGTKTLLEIKENDQYKDIKNIPLLFLTSLEDKPVDVRVARELGAADFVNKTVDFKDLLIKIKTALHIQ